MNSEGCKVNLGSEGLAGFVPNPIHLVAPFFSMPIPGTKVRQQRMKVPIIIKGINLRIFSRFIFENTKNKNIPAAPSTAWREMK
jgi:hypothetical protein